MFDPPDNQKPNKNKNIRTDGPRITSGGYGERGALTDLIERIERLEATMATLIVRRLARYEETYDANKLNLRRLIAETWGLPTGEKIKTMSNEVFVRLCLAGLVVLNECRVTQRWVVWRAAPIQRSSAQHAQRMPSTSLRRRCDEDAEGVACRIRENVERFDRVVEAVVQQTSTE